MSKIIRLPGLIDIHVHLKDPGETHKEDFYSGTCAALAGGVTTVFDMPNRSLHMLNMNDLNEKKEIATRKSVCDFGLYFGTDGNNLNQFDDAVRKVVGLKIYLNITTGHTQIEENRLEAVFNRWPKNKVIIVHVEDQKIEIVLNLAKKYGNTIHITHINTKKLLERVIQAKKDNIRITCDVTPHHLFLTKDSVDRLGGFAIMKPPLASSEDVDYLWSHLPEIDCIATDHAPHTVEEKKTSQPPTGVPGLETMLPLLLTSVDQGRLTIDDIIRLTNTNSQRIFGYHQPQKTFVEVDLDEKYLIQNENLKTKCGWSPFAGWEMTGKVKTVFIRGQKVYENGKILVQPGFGRNILSG